MNAIYNFSREWMMILDDSLGIQIPWHNPVNKIAGSRMSLNYLETKMKVCNQNNTHSDHILIKIYLS